MPCEPLLPVTLEKIRKVIEARGDLTAFYSDVFSRLSSSNHVLISVTPLDVIQSRLNHLQKVDPDFKQLPLHGVPFIAKDNIDAPPHPTTVACPSYSYIPTEPAHVINVLESLGAVLVAKANMDQFACGLVGTRSPYGTPLNPHNHAYVPGGSSSGSAVAVALGMCAFSLGTDTAGSGRVPAAMNGIVGLKPTKGVLSTRGVVPAAESQDCVSIFANSVEDASQIFAHLSANLDAGGAFSKVLPNEKNVPVNFLLSKEGQMGSFRFGVPRKDQLEFCGDKASEESFEKSISLLQGIGGRKIEIDFDPFRKAGNMLYESALVAERYATMGEFIREKLAANDGTLDASVAQIIMGGGEGKAAHDVFAAQKRLIELEIEGKRDTWSKVDVMVVPSVPCVMRIAQVKADPISQNSILGMYTNFVNLMDLCAVAIPAVKVDDESRVPRGITIIGQTFEEKQVIAIARKFEEGVLE